MTTPIPITDEAAQRRIDIRDAWDRYDGRHPASLTDSTGDVNDNVAINHLATIVDTGVDYLWGSAQGEVEFHVRRGDAEDADATEVLNAVWKRNRKRTLLQKLGVSGGISGHFALKLVPSPDESDVRVILLDPLDLILQSAPGDIDERIGYAIDTTIYDAMGAAIGRRREQHTINDDKDSWTIQWLVTDAPLDAVGLQHTVRWTPDPQRPDPEVWPYAWPAIIDGQNMPNPHREWGRADITPDILHIQEQINRVASNEAKTLRHFAHPQPVVQGSDPKRVQAAIDASIGSVLVLPEGSDYRYAQMQADGLNASREYRAQLTDALFEIGRVPRVAAGKVEQSGAQSGVALLLLYRPLIAKTEGKRSTYGDALQDLSLRALILLGVIADGDDDVTVEVSWPEVMPRNIDEEARTSESLQRVGVSQQTTLERLGFDPSIEAERRAEEANDPLGDTHGLLTRIEDEADSASDAIVSVSE